MEYKSLLTILNTLTCIAAIINLILLPIYVVFKEKLVEFDIPLNAILAVVWVISFITAIIFIIIIHIIENKNKK